MNWWTGADLLGVLVLLPALTVVFWRLLATLGHIATLLVPITEDCEAITGELDGISRLAETEVLTGAGLAGVTRCTSALAMAP